ncbi:MAG: ComF family protein [Pyrinomonadaceae bacterium]|nr:ComF family protein [Pyrinomonadaceae bacterium]
MNRSRAILSSLSDSLFSVFAPQKCALCENSVESNADGETCDECWGKAEIYKQNQALCHKCGLISRSNFSAESNVEKARCGQCDEDDFDAARAIGNYEGALRVAVLRLKERPFISLRLRRLLMETLINSPFDSATKILPIPLHPIRFRERGFNQAEILATELSRRSGLPFDTKNLVRSVYTKVHRTGMDAKARQTTVEKAFQVKSPRLIENETILLVDDVFTSGATVSGCAKVLKKAGADKVFVLTIARAVWL